MSKGQRVQDLTALIIFLGLSSLYDLKIGIISVPYFGTLFIILYMFFSHLKIMIRNGRYFLPIIVIIAWDIFVTFLTIGRFPDNNEFIFFKIPVYLNICLFVVLWLYFKYHSFPSCNHLLYIGFVLLILTQLSGFIFLRGCYLYEFAPDIPKGLKLNLYFADANYSAAYIILLYSLFFYLGQDSKIAILIGYVIAFILVILTYSRTGIILLAITGVFCLNKLLYSNKIANSLRKVALGLILLGVAIFCLDNANTLFSEISARFAYNRLYGESRLDMWKFAINNISILGIGIRTSEFSLYPDATLHNFYLELIVGLGICALFIFRLFFAKIRRALTVFPLLHLNLFIFSFFFSFSFVGYAWFFWAFLSAYRQKRNPRIRVCSLQMNLDKKTAL